MHTSTVDARHGLAHLPGLALTASAVAVAYVIDQLVTPLSMLVTALAIGVLAGNLGVLRPAHRPGLAFAARTLLRLGIILLGLELAVPDLLDLRAGLILLVVASVAVTFLGTLWLGRQLGMSRHQGLLVAVGVSVCGASAVAAMNAILDSEDDDVTTAVALVTCYGSAAIVVLPALGGWLALTPAESGMWAGASIHEVGQVVAAAGTIGAAAIAPSVLVKLTRVLLLAPLLAGTSMWLRHRSNAGVANGPTPPLVPAFIIGFIVAMVVRSMGVVPEPVVDLASVSHGLLLAAGMFGLGTTVRVSTLVRTGRRALVLGLLSSAVACAIPVAGLALLS